MVSLTNEAKFHAVFVLGYFYSPFFFPLLLDINVRTCIVSFSRHTLPKEKNPNKIFNLFFLLQMS